jgi:hypothetical protein
MVMPSYVQTGGAAAGMGGEPMVQTFASYNQERYFEPATAAIPPPSRVASLFPILDQFLPDGDLTSRAGAEL